MTAPTVPADLAQRISAAADALYAAKGGAAFPTVYEVRQQAGSGMAATQLVLRDWRRRHSLPPQGTALPESVQQHAQPLLATIWASACHAAEGTLRAEQERWAAQLVEDTKAQQELAERCDELEHALTTLRLQHEALRQEHAAQARSLYEAHAHQLAHKDAELGELHRQRLADSQAAQRAHDALQAELAAQRAVNQTLLQHLPPRRRKLPSS